MVVALVSIGSAIALIQMRTSMAILDADKASNLVMGQLRYAREIAVDQRRNVLIEFVGLTEIKVTRSDPGGGTTVMSDVYLPSGFTFSLPSGPGDTPEGYGNAAPVYFGAGDTSGTFLGDGTFVNAAGSLINGTVFTKGGTNGSARAVALSAAAGRLKQYYLQGNTWVIRG